jgi:hypothetical protein
LPLAAFNSYRGSKMTDRILSSNENLIAELEAAAVKWALEKTKYHLDSLRDARRVVSSRMQAPVHETKCVGCGGTLVRPELCDECFLAQKPDDNERKLCPSCGNDTEHGPHMPGCRYANAQKALEPPTPISELCPRCGRHMRVTLMSRSVCPICPGG